VEVDETWNDSQSAGVDHSIGGWPDVACCSFDVAVLDDHRMPVECLVGSEHAAAADDRSHLCCRIREHTIRGIAASEGFAVGPALPYAPDEVVDAVPASDPDTESTRFHGALEHAAKSLREVRAHAAQQIGEAEAQVFDAHLLMLQDPMLTGSVEQAIRSGASASAAVQHAIDEIAAMFAALPDEYFRAREADVRDVGQRLRRVLDGRPRVSLADLQAPVVVIAHDLSPSDTATLRRDMVLQYETFRRARLIGEVARGAHAHERWVGVCGEMASMPEAVPLLIGLGVDELSVSPPYVARTKARVLGLSRAACEALAAHAVGYATAAEVQAASLRYSDGGA